MGEKKKGSVGKSGIVDVVQAHLLRKSGVKITPALREYYRYTGISAEVEKHGLAHPEDVGFHKPLTPKTHEHGSHN